MICDQCRKESRTSNVEETIHIKTAAFYAPFYDEEGKLHIHDNNATVSKYTCSNGHTFSRKSEIHCWCGWNGIKKAKEK